MIRKLLVANRAEIAARVIRSARELDIATVAVFSDPDADAPHVHAADEAVRLPGASAADTYLHGDLLVRAAKETGADAVHPGYGFLSENATFAADCEAAGLIFVGPAPAAIEAMGSKTAAKKIMGDAGVPVLPSLTLSAGSSQTVDELVEAAAKIGYPVLVKAAFGGGGRGMRIVSDPSELVEAVSGAQREAAAAFGDGTVFLERYVSGSRHVEVQIFGDTFGTVVHLFERECSIQRRYQKIIEESPSPAVDEKLRAELGAAAVLAGRAIDYAGAGTVEFLLDESGEFFFLEMNTRLQVEHPVTELVTGLDLVQLQLLVAEGHPLPSEVLSASMTGHAIEARLYAEDVPAGFLPATGTLQRFDIPALPGIRVDGGVRAGSEVSVHYDPMLAKIIAYAPTREQAARKLARALAEARIAGVTTNRDLLVGVLREPEFLAGRTDTGYLGRHDPVALSAPHGPAETLRLHAVAAALAAQAERRTETPVLTTLPSGWRNVFDRPQETVFYVGDRQLTVTYRIEPDRTLSEVDGEEVPGLLVRAQSATEVDVEIAGVRRLVRLDRVDDVFYVDSTAGSTVLTEAPRFPDPTAAAAAGSLLAPMPGTVVRVPVSEGDTVTAGAGLIVLEAMKMEHTVSAPHDGVVTRVATSVGASVNAGDVLVVVEEKS
jgi:acetyl/propionyl-CoA carboxylase alpha subunit